MFLSPLLTVMRPIHLQRSLCCLGVCKGGGAVEPHLTSESLAVLWHFPPWWGTWEDMSRVSMDAPWQHQRIFDTSPYRPSLTVGALFSYYLDFFFHWRRILLGFWRCNWAFIPSWTRNRPRRPQRGEYIHTSYCHWNPTTFWCLPCVQANILVTDLGRACISDFGSSTIQDAFQMNGSTSLCGTTRWQAPELLSPEVEFPRASPESDVYAYACVLYEVCFNIVSLCNAFSYVVKLIRFTLARFLSTNMHETSPSFSK